MAHALRLGTASWIEGAVERRAMVAPLPSDPTRYVDLNRVERIRLAKLGEGLPEALADVLVPASLRRVLEGGTRALQRVRQTLAYAEKWRSRGDLPDSLALPSSSIRMLPCLPRPLALRRVDGTSLDRLSIQGLGGTLGNAPQPTLGIIGIHRSSDVAWCLALEDGPGAVLGRWLTLEDPRGESIELRCGSHYRRLPQEAWSDWELPIPRAGEVVILPSPRLRALPSLVPGSDFSITTAFDTLILKLGNEIPHQTVQ